jgi:hypothetical protein
LKLKWPFSFIHQLCRELKKEIRREQVAEKRFSSDNNAAQIFNPFFVVSHAGELGREGIELKYCFGRGWLAIKKSFSCAIPLS